ncbi:MAG TPA: DUF169 domain-containing protein [Syntrophorhabdaceae bacterium]|nr:DUF169 domain-containing protein [Syntrophorhabdaceae bacterium]
MTINVAKEASMDMQLKDRFMKLWVRYFDGAELPITFFYTDKEDAAPKVKPPKRPGVHRCVIADIARARNGKPLCFDINSMGCEGGKRYFGFSESLRPNFEYFLSYGIPGELTGERYKKSPELVNTIMKRVPTLHAPGKYIIFKRWDLLDKGDNPEAAIFFSPPDAISGLFTLANYDEKELNGVFTPFGAGCATIVLYPYFENRSRHPRGVLGMFDVSARPCVQKDLLTITFPMKKFKAMIGNMEESFLITESWKKVKKRIAS